MWPFFIRKRRLTAIGVPVFIWLVCATSAAPKNEFVSAEGVVVAIQGGKTDTRLIEPASFADLAEIYMVRVDRWSQPRKEKYILVEYIHHAGLIRYDEFDKTRWNFEIHQASPEETRDCLSWMVREGSFHPTAFGAKAKLPDPKGLTCFLMEKRPLVVSERVDFVIDENKPFVYVRFDHVGTGEQRSEDESTSRIWLRIVNNCRFPIVLRTTGVPDESPKEEVGVMYEVAANPVTQGMVILSRPPTSGQSTPLTGNENEKPLAKSESTEMPKGTMFHVGSAQVLPPSKNIMFSIPVNHLGKKWHIEIPFKFDLPAGKGPHDPNAGGEPILVIEYSMWDLPPKFRTEIQK